METEKSRQPRVALFVTCLVDLFRPTVGFAAVQLLESAGCTVDTARQVERQQVGGECGRGKV